MEWVRLVLRIILLSIVFPSFYLVYIVGILLLSFNTKLKLLWRNFTVQWWCKALLLLLNVKVEVKGTRPTSPFFLVSNHLGYLDILVYFSILHCVFVSR
ncbi:MAG: hypothetical protein DWQ10_06555, partial [Calditrichaeota bacterium]